MAYNNPNMGNPGMRDNPGHGDKEAKLNELCEELDDIASYLYRGVHWHTKAANYSRENLIRGFGRWHDAEAKGDFCALQNLEKIAGDKLGHIMTVDMAMVSKAESYVMPDINAFKAHFDIWERNEKEFIDCLNEAIELSRCIDIQIYQELICMAKEVQDEIMRACMAKNSLAFGGWSAHDISMKSMIIHKYFETEHKDGGEININLG
ncbi:MAG: hypothetical protein FWD71_22320 [Oscillospiraceae bacterium]|nr:hypothetical protein [Oscillospiraceae bacterium]